MSNAGPLSDRSKKELAEMARRRGIRGWDSMSKDELVRAIDRAKKAAARSSASKAAPVKVKPRPARTSVPTVKSRTARPTKATKPTRPVRVSKPAVITSPRPDTTRPGSRPTPASVPPKPAAKSAAKVTRPLPDAKPKPPTNGTHAPPRPAAVPVSSPKPPVSGSNGPAKPAPAKPPVVPAVAPRALPVSPPIPAGKNLSTTPAGQVKDRIFLMVPDPFWLHATWELTQQSVLRAEAALKQDWHGAKPIIRLFDVTSTDTTSTSETPVRDIHIHGGSNHWYIDIPQPPRQYRADIGYLSKRGDFYVLARSNVVTPPKAGSSEAIDLGWADIDTKKAERILAMSTGFESAGHPELKELFEERFRRPMGPPKDMGFGTGASLPGSLKKFFFELDAKLVVIGHTDPTAHVTLQNEPVKLAADGSFVMWFSLPDSRQIIPAVATSADGVEERTIVLAVERNTKHLDPMIHDQMNEV